MSINKNESFGTKRTGYYISDQFATYFVTFTVIAWADVFTRLACKHIIIDSLGFCQINKGLIVYSYVIMSNHLHLILQAKEGSAGISNIIRDFKKYTSKELSQWILKNERAPRKKWMINLFAKYGKANSNNTGYQVWIQDNNPKILLYPKFTLQKLDYIHNNPVRSGIVLKAEDYIFSSASNYYGCDDNILDVTIIDFGVQDGFVIT